MLLESGSLWYAFFSLGDQAARGAAKRGRNERSEAAESGGREFKPGRRGHGRGAAPVGAVSGDRRAHKFSASFARNPLISPESRKFFETFGKEWNFFEAFWKGIEILGRKLKETETPQPGAFGLRQRRGQSATRASKGPLNLGDMDGERQLPKRRLAPPVAGAGPLCYNGASDRSGAISARDTVAQGDSLRRQGRFS